MRTVKMRIIIIDNQTYIYAPLSQMIFQREEKDHLICRHVGNLCFNPSNGKKYIEPLKDSGKVLRIKMKHS